MKHNRTVKEVIQRVYPKSKRCIFCPQQKRLCAIDDICPCPWRSTKLEILEVIKQFNAPPPRYIRKGSFFDNVKNMA